MEEYFDILDENGKKTGKTKLRKEVHKDGDWHKAVHVWIINDQNEILLQRRSKTKDSNPNKISIFNGGHLSAGDTSIDGVKRELKEELNLTVEEKDLKFIKTIKRSAKYTPTYKNNEFDDLYILKVKEKISDMVYQKEEISEIFFVQYNKLKEMVKKKEPDLLIDTFEEEIETLFSYLDKVIKNDR